MTEGVIAHPSAPQFLSGQLVIFGEPPIRRDTDADANAKAPFWSRNQIARMPGISVSLFVLTLNEIRAFILSRQADFR
jgi:hypothetical protein